MKNFPDYIDEPFYMDQLPPVNHAVFADAQMIASIQSKLASHISNKKVHVTEEEKETWNNKVSTADLEALRDELNAKIEELKELISSPETQDGIEDTVKDTINDLIDEGVLFDRTTFEKLSMICEDEIVLDGKPITIKNGLIIKID